MIDRKAKSVPDFRGIGGAPSPASPARRQLIAAVVPFAFACAVWPRDRLNVLFVCRYGTVKSPIARELARHRAADRGLRLDIVSRGLTPEDHMTPELRAALSRDGIDVSRESLRALATTDLERADIIVAFDPMPFAFGGWRTRDWSDTPSMIADYGVARAALLRRIDVLLDEIERRRGENAPAFGSARRQAV